jgi:hypothetical protein
MEEQMNRRVAAPAPQAVESQDKRLALLNAFMTCPHRDTDRIKQIHDEVRKQDPVFYAHLACWYDRTGDIRDHKEVFASMLTVDPFMDNREVGLALFRDMPIFLKKRVVGFIKGKKVKIRTKTGEKMTVEKGKAKGKVIEKVRVEERKVGLDANVPHGLKTEVKNYLRWLESNDKRWDEAAIRSFWDLKYLYKSGGLQIKPSPRAQEILFEGKVPEGSKLNVLEEFRKAKTPEEAAKLIVENKIPYTVAVGLTDKVTPSILVALIERMSPQELLNNIASLEEKGAMAVPEVKAIIDKKLVKAKTAKGVSALKSKTAKATGRIKDESTAKKLDEIADTQIKSKGVISLSTAILIDRSGSMTEAIEVGKRLATVVSGATVANLQVVAFDSSAAEVVSKGKTLSDWEDAFKGINPGGQTSIGSALYYLLRKKVVVEQIVVVTDEGENALPWFTDIYEKYCTEMKVKPHVVVMHVGGADKTFSTNLTRAKIEFDTYTPEGSDYYGMPGIIQLLARKSKLDLVYEIMDEPLRKRVPFKG